MGKKPEIGAYYDERTKRWIRATADEVAKMKAHAGEQAIGFYLGERGYFIVEGPSGAGGHSSSAKGFDGVAYHPQRKELIIYDNKAYRDAGKVSKADPLDSEKNLRQYLDDLIERIEKSSPGGPSGEMPHKRAILKRLKDARSAVVKGTNWPRAVKLYVYNASGQSSGVSKRLKAMGVVFKNYYEFAGVRRPWYRNASARAIVEQISKRTRKLEFEAAKQISERGRRAVSNRVVKAVAQHGRIFAKKRLPKMVSEMLLRASAKKAARRAASLVPLAGWGFAASDAYRGVEDVLRGNVARGLAGVGLSIVDVASDFLHLGDAVSGVGGTALSLGVQAGTIAGQISIEVSRLEDKLKELGEEIERDNRLPPDGRLRDYYEMDEEDISKLKADFEQSLRESDAEAEPEPPPPPREYVDPPPVYEAPPPPPPPPPYAPAPAKPPLPRNIPAPAPVPIPRDFPCV